MTRPALVEVVSPAPRTTWRAVVGADREALPEHAPEWVDAVCESGSFEDASRCYAFADGRQFVLPLVRRRGVLGSGGWLLSYPPAWGMGGLVGAGADGDVLRVVRDDLAALRSQRIGIRPNPLQDALWSGVADRSVTTVRRRGHVVDLSGGIDAVEGRIHKATRKYIRRAERAGVRVQVDRGTALLDSYYDLYLTSVDRWAGRQHEPVALARWRAGRRDPQRKLEAIARHLGEAFVVAMAFVDDQPAFGSIMLLGQSAHVTRSAMDIDRVGPTKAGSLVHWRMLQLACDHGCSRYHLGESGESDSLAQFKEGFGAVGIGYAEYRWERLPYTRADHAVRTAAKKVLRFRDV